MGDRCTGHCCKAFTLPYDPKELREKTLAGKFSDGDEKVADMVIYLGFAELPPNGPAHHNTHGLPDHWYTCKNLTPEGNCAIYEDRPRLCRDFPYKAPCPYPACEWHPELRPDVKVSKLVPLKMLKKRLSEFMKVTDDDKSAALGNPD